MSHGDPSVLTCSQLLRRFRQEAQPRPDEARNRPRIAPAQRRTGLSQEELAARSELSGRSIREIESGRNVPMPDTIRVLAEALCLSPEQHALSRETADRERASRRAQQAVRRASASPAVDSPTSGAPLTPLIGRERELDLLERHLAGTGTPPMLVFAGEPGIGKTRLLDETAARAAGHELRVLRAGCWRHGDTAYAPLLDALKDHVKGQKSVVLRRELRGCAWLVRLLPEFADKGIEPLPAWPVPPAQERRLMFDAVARFLQNIAGPAGTLLVLDDLQWVGQDALALLLFLLRTPAPHPPAPSPTPVSTSPSPARGRGGWGVRVVGAYRDNETPPDSPLAVLLADLAGAGLVTHHALEPLSSHEAGQLFDALTGDAFEAEDAVRERVVRDPRASLSTW